MHILTLYLLFFLLGIVTDFTTTTESYWMRDAGYRIEEITTISYIIDFAWGVRFLFGYVPDLFPRFTLFFLMISFMTNTIIWFFISPLTLPSSTLVFLLFIAEFAPAAGLTIADSLMVKACKDHTHNVAQYSHGIRTFGKAIAGYVGSVIQTSYNYTTVFYLQFQFSCILTLFLAVCMFYDARSSPQETKEDDEECALQQKDVVILYPEEPIRYTSITQRPEYPYLAVLTCVMMMPSANQAIYYDETGPLRIVATVFGLSDLLSLVSVFGTCFVFSSWGIRDVLYYYITFTLFMNIPSIWILARQNIVEDSVLIIVVSVLTSFVTSMLVTRMAVENSKMAPQGSEGVSFALYSCIPGFGRFLGTLTTIAYTDYFNVNHDHFDDIALFNAVCICLQSLNVFLPVFM